jgi:hypothetical protein
MLSSPVMFKNCFGVEILLKGQKRVPPPPAMITPYLSIDITPIIKNKHTIIFTKKTGKISCFKTKLSSLEV